MGALRGISDVRFTSGPQIAYLFKKDLLCKEIIKGIPKKEGFVGSR